MWGMCAVLGVLCLFVCVVSSLPAMRLLWRATSACGYMVAVSCLSAVMLFVVGQRKPASTLAKKVSSLQLVLQRLGSMVTSVKIRVVVSFLQVGCLYGGVRLGVGWWWWWVGGCGWVKVKLLVPRPDCEHGNEKGIVRPCCRGNVSVPRRKVPPCPQPFPTAVVHPLPDRNDRHDRVRHPVSQGCRLRHVGVWVDQSQHLHVYSTRLQGGPWWLLWALPLTAAAGRGLPAFARARVRFPTAATPPSSPPPSCLLWQTASLDQFDRLLLVTVVPVGILVLLACLHAAAPCLLAARRRGLSGCRGCIRRRCSCRRRCPRVCPCGRAPPASEPAPAVLSEAAPPPSQEALATLRTRLVKGALVLIFLIYPGISSETVKSFRWVAICSDAALLLLGHGCGGASRTSAACAQRGAVLGTHVANDVFYVYFKLFTF
jgi:hypothetical protein